MENIFWGKDKSKFLLNVLGQQILPSSVDIGYRSYQIPLHFPVQMVLCKLEVAVID